MRRRIALLGVVAACFACGGNPSTPTPSFIGNYSFILEASSVCDLPVERFEWLLVATSSGGGPNAADNFRMTLPGGDPTVSLNLAYTQQSNRRGPTGPITLSVNMNVQQVRVGNLVVTMNGSPAATAREAPNGLAEVIGGTVNGTMRLEERGPRGGFVQVGSCVAADHHFSLISLFPN
jgi:hypothetical protein